MSGGGAGGMSGGGAGGMPAVIPNLYFSEYVEGDNLDDALEIYNAGTTGVSLAGCSVRVHLTAATAFTAIPLSGTLAAGDVVVLCRSMISAACDSVVGTTAFPDLSGDDAVELVCPVNGTATTLDLIGAYGTNLDPGMQWGGGTGPGTQNRTLRRRCTTTQGDRTVTNTFTPNTQWLGYDVDNVGGLGVRTCPCPMVDLTCP